MGETRAVQLVALKAVLMADSREIYVLPFLKVVL